MISPVTLLLTTLWGLPLELSPPTNGIRPGIELINENDNWGLNLYKKGADDFGRTFGGSFTWQSGPDAAGGQWWGQAESLHGNCNRVLGYPQRLDTSSLCRRAFPGWNPSQSSSATETLRSDLLTLTLGRSNGDHDRRIWWGAGWGWIGKSPITPLPQDIQDVVHDIFGFPVYVESTYAPPAEGPLLRGGAFRRWRIASSERIWIEQSTSVLIAPYMAALGTRVWTGQRVRIARGHLEIRGGADLQVQEVAPQLKLAFRNALAFNPSAEARLIAPKGFAFSYRLRFLLDGQESVGSWMFTIPI